MKAYLYNLFIIAISLLVFYYFALPPGYTLAEIIQVYLFSVVVVPLYIQRFRKGQKSVITSLGFIFFILMWLIMIIGNANLYIILYLHPLYNPNFDMTNWYWIAGMILFAEGFFLFKNIGLKKYNEKSYLVNKAYVWIVFLMGFAGTIFLYLEIGYFPILERTREFQIETFGSLFVRIWNFSTLAVLVTFIYAKKIKNPFYLILTFVAMLSTTILNQRMLIFAALASVFIYLWLIIKNKKILIVYAFIGGALFMLSNIAFHTYRNPEVFLGRGTDTGSKLTNFQSKGLHVTFNEYNQLHSLTQSNYNDFKYGSTFTSIPLGFFPAFLLDVVGINKSDHLRNNSAIIYADFIRSKHSTGIRTGIMGEGFVNFYYFGAFVMLLVGIFVKWLQNRVISVGLYDYRFAIYLNIYIIILYSLIGQIDVIGSLMIQLVIFSYLIKKLWKPIFSR